MNWTRPDSYQIAIPKTIDGDGIAKAIYGAMKELGHRPKYFKLEGYPPEGTDIVFLFGPFGKFLHIPQMWANKQPSHRPALIFWNTEGLPDPRLPRLVTDFSARFRSWVGRLSHSQDPRTRLLAARSPLSLIEARLVRFRFLGDYLYAHNQGWVDVFADISDYYAGLLRQRGLPAIHVPFGSYTTWFADLNLERDIDVLWMGKRASKRRSQALDLVTGQLRAQGLNVMVIDNIEHPFVYDDERTRLVNRSKITLNLLRTWYDENSLRICIAAPNRSLVVSEPLLPHVPQYVAGVHYVSVPIENMAAKIIETLNQPQEMKRITQNAYDLTTQTLTFRNSMQRIIEVVQMKFSQAQPQVPEQFFSFTPRSWLTTNHPTSSSSQD